jgi:rare lipoprotein A
MMRRARIPGSGGSAASGDKRMAVQPVQSVAYIPVNRMPVRFFARAAGLTAVGVLLANCAADPSGGKRQLSAQNQREIGAFSNKAKYGSASPRVVDHGQSVPKGGGKDHVGRPYRVAGRWYTPRDNPAYSATGAASWYGDAFHGRKTANGEIYDKHAYTAAHPTMPLPSYARVTNLSNGHSIVVRVNDRGPFHGGRIIDLSERVAYALNFKHIGTARVKVDYLQRASTSGSDDRKLVATLRTDGQQASLPGGSSPIPGAQPILVASNSPTVPLTAASPGQRPRPEIIPGTPPPTPAIARPQPAPQPVQPAVAPAEDSELRVAETRQIRRDVPLPPERPFDLGSIPGGATPLLRVNNGQVAAAPRVEPPRSRVAAVYFAPTAGFADRFGAADPMAKLRPGSFADVAHRRVAGAEGRPAR